MLFSSLIFLYAFLPCTLLAYFLTPRRGKNPVLLLASLLFYAWGEPRYLILILLNILLGFTAGLGIHRFRGRLLGRLFLLTSVAGSLGLLCCFKYGDFFLSAINGALGISLPLWRLALPVGISFYTFQILSYTIDLYRGDVEVQRNPVSFALYVALFPQLIAGPIVRYRDVAQELQERKHSTAMAYEGACRFLVGLGKKVILANNLGLLCQSYRSSADPTVLFAWLSALGFFLQIYYDFSGYSDMAIGLGRILGFHFPENFRYPYCSRSVTEFWRRWHMTLGAWFRDYVYIPLGGNRTGKLRWMGNILLVWCLTGLWHGAGWNFLLWGLFYAILLLGEKLWYGPFLAKMPWFSHIYLLLSVLLGFVLFQGGSLEQSWEDFRAMLGAGSIPTVSRESLYALRNHGVLLILGALGATPLPGRLYRRWSKGLQWIEPLLLALLLLLCTAYLVDGSFNPFLYFRF
ncbi:membrane bound O-acyl transferase MBOAT family protein [Firmicutes bacterium CAG:137]|jgi:alginate O-acetyltransferase complex protein AlgI|nr:membrane bound O-acyl transferase MBOAT family protein [Firmicutes bacterium CAG:137]